MIIRTAAEGVSEDLILEDLERLRKTWEDLVKKFKRSRKPQVLLREPDVLETILRDRIDKSLDKLITNDVEIADKVRKIMEVYKKSIEIEYVDGSVFQELGIYEEIEKLSRRVVHLDSGAYIAIDRTEAMTVIDVNSASFTSSKSHSQLILETNIEAAKEIARQLRLRNIGGIIVVDFITMDREEDRKKVIEELKKALKRDRARTEILGFTRLGLLEMTRKRTSRSIDSIFLSSCPVCGGSGKVVSPSITFKKLIDEIGSIDAKSVKIRVHQVMSGYFNSENVKKLQRKLKKKLEISYDLCDPTSFEVKFER